MPSTLQMNGGSLNLITPYRLGKDLLASLVIFLVALPLCIGIAMASGAPPIAGVVAGIIGGILVGILSGSHTSVSGPANGLPAIAATLIVTLGSYEAFLLAVVIAGGLQIALGIARAGFIAAFVPSSVINGLLAAIGVILVMKQIPHVFGHDADPEGDMAFFQFDNENTFSEFGELLFDIHPGATAIGLASIALIVVWNRVPQLKGSPIPAPLVVVVLGVAMNGAFRAIGGAWSIQETHLVQVPVADSLSSFLGFLARPDFTQAWNPAIYTAGLTIAAVASLETLLNLEAIDKIDPQQRDSPPSRELVAQGIGNVVSGLLGGLPLTSVVVRSSVNVNSGGQTKLATIGHGVLLLVCVMLCPMWLNMIPLSCLAAILFITGVKLASPKLIKQMWAQGRYQFIPFAATVVAIVLTDMLNGILIGLAVSASFILNSNLRRPLRRFVEKQIGGDVLHIELANQVSFLNRAALGRVLDDVPRGGHVLLDAQHSDYIDPDVLSLIRDFKEHSAPARGVEVSLLGFRHKYHLEDRIQYVDHSTRELQAAISPEQVLQILKDGNERFRTGQRLTRDMGRQVTATALSQHPLAVILSCIDSRTPAELVFDLGVGDIFSVRVAGNITSPEVLGSMEYACAVAGAKLIVVLGHTRCGAVTAAVELAGSTKSVAEATGCQHVGHILSEIQSSMRTSGRRQFDKLADTERADFVNETAMANVTHTVANIDRQSETLARLLRAGRIAIVGAMYDVATGEIQFLPCHSLEDEAAIAPLGWRDA